MFLTLKIIFLLLTAGLTRSLPISGATESVPLPSDLENAKPFKVPHRFQYLKYMNPYVNESLTSPNETTFQTDERDKLKDQSYNRIEARKSEYEANAISGRPDSLNRYLSQASLADKVVLIVWTLKEIIKLWLSSLDHDSLVKKLYTTAGELNREDVCVPFALGLLAGLVFLVVLNLLKCCLRRFCWRRPVNRIHGYKKRLLNKRNPLEETHHLLVSHCDLSDQEV